MQHSSRLRLALVRACTLALAAAGTSSAWADTRDIPVPLQVIPAGQVITSALLQEKSFLVPPAAESRFVLTRLQAEGLTAKRALPAGKPIPLAFLKQHQDVVQGVPVEASFSAQGLVITTILVPLQSATEGDVIDARNTESGAIVKARVKPDGTLQVGE
jgi:flagella basal body P-ring formation protein FlgA